MKAWRQKQEEKVVCEQNERGSTHSPSKYFEVADESTDLTSQELRNLKLKSRIFFLLAGVAYGIQTMDKFIVSVASVMGLKKEYPIGLSMKGDMYSYVNISYWIGYIVTCIPLSTLLLEKVGARYNGLSLAAGGVIIACSSASRNYAGYIVTRTLLGVLSSTCEPTVVMMIHQWTHGGDHYGWALTWITWNGVVEIFMQAVGYGLYSRGHPTSTRYYGMYSLAPWRIILIIVGLMTFIYGILFYFFVPNSPQDSGFLSGKEKSYMRQRNINRLNTTFKYIHVNYSQIVEAFTSGLHHSALLFFAVLANAINGSAVNTFNNIWLKQFIEQAHPQMSTVESNEESLLYGMIAPAVKVVMTILVSAATLKGVFRNYRCVYIIFFMVIHLIATCLLTCGPTPYARYGGLFIYNATVEVAHAGLFSVVASNIGGSSKKITVNGLLMIAQGLGGCIGPRAFSNVSSQSPARTGSMIALSAFSLVCICGLFLSFYIENRIRDAANEELPKGFDRLEITDREDVGFRYHL